MDIDFIIQDTYALTRPQWRLAPNLDEAGRAFADSVAQNYQSQEPDKAAEAETFDDDGSSDDEGDEDDMKLHDNDSSNEENEAEVCQDGLALSQLMANEKFRSFRTATRAQIPILRKRLPSLGSMKQWIQRQKPILIESLQK